MKKLTFKVSAPKDSSVASLIKEVNKISCRIFLDLEKGFVVVEDVNDSMIDDVIELIDNYYTIMNINIDNIFEEAAENNSTVLKTQAEDDVIVKKFEFENEYIENHINNFLKTVDWALYNRGASEKEIGNYILTCMSEISMRFSPKPIIEFDIGDIVDVNYGSHLPGEIIGGHVHAVVCHILNDDMVYIVPLTKVKNEITSSSYLIMDVPHDAIYNNRDYKGGTVIVEKGKYVRAERFNFVIGKTKPAFFEKLLYQLARTFDFTNGFDEEVEEDCNLTSTMEVTPEKVEKTSVEEVEPNLTAKKVGREESALLEVIGFALDKLDSSKTVEEQVETFLTDIGMTTAERMVTQSFVVACDIKKINYENIILGLHTQFPKVKEEIIKNILKEEFKNWLDKYPTLAEKCPKISLMAVLKVFAKRFA